MSDFCKLTGDWNKLGITLQRLSATLFPLAKIKLQEDGEMVLQKLKGHIDSQDLGWTKLSKDTIKQKGSSKTYIETRNLYNNLKIVKLPNAPKGTSIFIGANPHGTHSPSGLKIGELMVFLEYGTSTIPPRPLIRPTWEEVEPLIKDNMAEVLEELVRG